MKKWFTKSEKPKAVRSGDKTSFDGSSINYTKLPKNLDQLDKSYKVLIKELGKR